MAGYNPVYGGFPGISEPTYGLQEAYGKRIDTIENTLKDKYNMTDAEIADVRAGSYTGDVDTNLLKTLTDLDEAKEKEKARLDLFSGDVDDRDQLLEDIVAQNKATAEIEPTRLKHLTGDWGDLETALGDLDKQATIPLGKEPSLEIERLAAAELPVSEEVIRESIGDDEALGMIERTGENLETAVEVLSDHYDKEIELGARDHDPTTTSKVNKAKAVINMPQMLGDVGGSMDDAPPSAPTRTVSRTDTDYGQFGRRQEATSAGGGNDGGGGGRKKIVCTMMNDSYGFGSFRNKIWIKYARDHLSPEYQKGYHKLFLPLVKYAKQDGITNRIVKKVLEHIAVHRTIDIRQEARGKRHLLGRIYRRILEPICYWAGK
jgi:hypothetical protein